MAILGVEGAIEFIKNNQKPHAWISEAREDRDELFALIEGEGFDTLLINRIEYVGESENKALARRKYSRNITDLFERLFKNLDNVYSATGGSKQYKLDDKKKEELTKSVSSVRGGKSLEQWNETFWMPAYHYDPNGVTILEYSTELQIDPFPKQISIKNIRSYIPNGIKVEVILFEPVTKKVEGVGNIKEWRLIDDQWDYRFIQRGKEVFLDEKRSFEHPFGEVPVLINSDLIQADGIKRVSPVAKIVPITKEYARDQSIKTIFKFTQGIPLFWRYVSQCVPCTGLGRIGDELCKDCNGHGYAGRRDITDQVELPIPTKDEEQLAPNIAGWIIPPIEIWQRYDDELKLLEDLIFLTHWGRVPEGKIMKTATQIIDDSQKLTQGLGKYSNAAENRQAIQTEWIANFKFPEKNKDEKIASISLGRQYAILPASTILEVYQIAKDKGDNTTILDKLFNEYLMSKHKSDAVALSEALLKANVEPYLHSNVKEVNEIFGRVEAQKKILFEDWWRSLQSRTGESKTLKTNYSEWFDKNNPAKEEDSLNIDKDV